MIKYVFKYINKNKYLYALYVTIAFIYGSITILEPLITSQIIDYLTYSDNLYHLKKLCIIFLIVSLMKIVTSYISNILFVKIQVKCAFKINRDIIDHIQNLPLNNVPSKNSSYLTQRINNDSNDVTRFVITLINDTVLQFIYFCFASLFLFYTNRLIFIALIILSFMYLLLYIICKKHIFNYSMNFKEKQSDFFSALNEQIEKNNFINTHSLYNWFHRRLTLTFKSVYSSIVKMQTFNFMYSSLEMLINVFASTTIFLLGGIAIIKGDMTIGIFIIAINYFNLMINSIRFFSGIGKKYQDSLVSYDRIIEIINIKKRTNGNVILDQVDVINIHNLNFTYQNSNEKVIDNLSWQLKRGYIYGIIGENGCGKSTFIKLLLGLYNEGNINNIKYNEISINNIDMKHLRHERISIIEQEPTLINDTIMNNISLDREYSKSEIDHLVNKLKFGDLLQRFPNELLTIIDNNSTNVSGGEKQKIAILRQLLPNYDVIILDEPTSALDEESKNSLLDLLEELKNDKIIIIVTHDSKIMNKCDYLINLGRG